MATTQWILQSQALSSSTDPIRGLNKARGAGPFPLRSRAAARRLPARGGGAGGGQ